MNSQTLKLIVRGKKKHKNQLAMKYFNYKKPTSPVGKLC